MMNTPRPIRTLLDLFSSVRFGIVLLILLFVYSSIGSAGVLYPVSLNFLDLDNWDQFVVRQQPWFELTEYQWFQWWPFQMLIGLICTTLVTTTIRRIPFKPANYGVWMIHTGIITLSLGSVWYFSTKFEGDAPIARRNVVIQIPGQPAQRIVARVGNQAVIDAAGSRYSFEVSNIDPNWELRSGTDAGETTYAVSVLVRTPKQTFIRQLLAGYPQYTEDVIPGEGRAVKVTGQKLVDDTIDLRLEYDPVEFLYLVQSDALYVREVGERGWVERPINGLPKYNEYLASYEEVWPIVGKRPPLRPLKIRVPAVADNDPLPELAFTVGSYLRYAATIDRRIPGGNQLDPFLKARLVTDDGAAPRLDMVAFDPARNSFAEGFAVFRWVEDQSQFDEIHRQSQGVLDVSVPDQGASLRVDVAETPVGSDAPFREIEGTDYAFRIVETRDRLQADARGSFLSVALLDIRTSERTVRRWVFDRAEMTRDNILDEATGTPVEFELDRGISIQYRPAAAITFVAGPDEADLRVIIVNSATGESRIERVQRGSRVALNAALTLAIDEYAAYSRMAQKPYIVPPSQRQRELDLSLRMIRLELPGPPGGPPASYWLPFHPYAYESEADAFVRALYEPTRIALSDGREFEVLYARRRMKLAAPIVLERFNVEYHVGGFSGDNRSVKNWQSVLRFQRPDGAFTDEEAVAVNAPVEYRGMWFFQKAWDPPTPGGRGGGPSAGLNHTVLGVANREGVLVQLFGCCLAVLGMLYAFYVKPIIKRKQQQSVYQAVAAGESAVASKGDRPMTLSDKREVLV